MSIVLDIDKLEAEKKKKVSWQKFELKHQRGRELKIYLNGKFIKAEDFMKLPDKERPTSPKYKGQTQKHDFKNNAYISIEFKAGDKIAIPVKTKKQIGTLKFAKAFINVSDISA